MDSVVPKYNVQKKWRSYSQLKIVVLRQLQELFGKQNKYYIFGITFV